MPRTGLIIAIVEEIAHCESEDPLESTGIGALGSNHRLPRGPISLDDILDVTVLAQRVHQIWRKIDPSRTQPRQISKKESKVMQTHSSISGTASLAIVFSFHMLLHRVRTS